MSLRASTNSTCCSSKRCATVCSSISAPHHPTIPDFSVSDYQTDLFWCRASPTLSGLKVGILQGKHMLMLESRILPRHPFMRLFSSASYLTRSRVVEIHYPGRGVSLGRVFVHATPQHSPTADPSVCLQFGITNAIHLTARTLFIVVCISSGTPSLAFSSAQRLCRHHTCH